MATTIATQEQVTRLHLYLTDNDLHTQTYILYTYINMYKVQIKPQRCADTTLNMLQMMRAGATEDRSGRRTEVDRTSQEAKSFGSYHGRRSRRRYGGMEGWRDGRGGGEAGEVTVGAYHWPYHRGVRGGGGRRRGGGGGGRRRISWL